MASIPRLHSISEDKGNVEKSAEFFDVVTDELLWQVLSFVPPLELLRSTCKTCTRFAAILSHSSFWEKCLICTEKIPEKVRLSLSKQQIQKYAAFDYATSVDGAETLGTLQLSSLLPTQETTQRIKRMARTTCLASTTDQPSETLDNVLQNPVELATRLFPPRFQHLFRKWWSSRPTPESDSRNELLLFATSAPTCLLTKILVRPLKDPYLGHVVYTWKKTKIRAYWLANQPGKMIHGFPCSFPYVNAGDERGDPANLADVHSDQSLIDVILENEIPVYESGDIDTVDLEIDDMITFCLPRGGIVANVFTLELIGKHAQQTPNSGYYTCVHRLECHGIPL